jgi:hypothetical protein
MSYTGKRDALSRSRSVTYTFLRVSLLNGSAYVVFSMWSTYEIGVSTSMGLAIIVSSTLNFPTPSAPGVFSYNNLLASYGLAFDRH